MIGLRTCRVDVEQPRSRICASHHSVLIAMSTMNITGLCKTAVLGIALCVLADTGTDAKASSAVDEIRDLYAEFQTFKHEEEFRRVGYGRCCKYYQWMKKVDALRGNDPGDFLRSFGILPGELISLGMEYYQGRGNQDVAKMWEASVEAVLNPSPAEAPIDAKNDEPDRVIGRWVVRFTRTLSENVTIATVDGTLQYTGEFNDGSSRHIELVELRAKTGELRRFRGSEGSAWGLNDRVAVLTDGKLAFYDELGHIRTAEPR